MKQKKVIILIIIVAVVIAVLGVFIAFQFLGTDETYSTIQTNATEDYNVETSSNLTSNTSDTSDTSSTSDTSNTNNTGTSTTVTDMTTEIKTIISENLPGMLGGGDTLAENIADVGAIENMGVGEYLDSATNLAYAYALGGYSAMFEGTERINVIVNNVSAVTVTDTVKIFTVEYTATIHDEIVREEGDEVIPDMDIGVVATITFNSDNKIVSWTEEITWY